MRFLLPLLSLALRQIAIGALITLGSTLMSALLAFRKKGCSMLAQIDLLFHPNVTRTAVICSALLNLAGLCTALGSAAGAFNAVFGHNGPAVAGGLVLLGIACAQIAGWGRSTVSAVDNNVKP